MRVISLILIFIMTINGCGIEPIVSTEREVLAKAITNSNTDRMVRLASIEKAQELYPGEYVHWLGVGLNNTPDKYITDEYIDKLTMSKSLEAIRYLCEYGARCPLEHDRMVRICESISGQVFPEYLLDIVNEKDGNEGFDFVLHARLWEYVAANYPRDELCKWVREVSAGNDLVRCLKFYSTKLDYIAFSSGEIIQCYMLIREIEDDYLAEVVGKSKEMGGYKFRISDMGLILSLPAEQFTKHRNDFIGTAKDYITNAIHVTRPPAYKNATNDRTDSFIKQIDDLTITDLLRIMLLCESIYDKPQELRELLYDAYDNSEIGGLCYINDGSLKFKKYSPGASKGSHKYIESKNTMADSVMATARWHVHDQRSGKGNLAGPGLDDMEFAVKVSSNIVIFTILDSDDNKYTVNIDLVTAAGMIVDLGVVEVMR